MAKNSSYRIDPSRRLFAKRLAVLGLGASLSTPLVAQSPCKQHSDQEYDQCNQAHTRMLFASPYATQQWRSSPHMHQELKRNIEYFSNGKIYFDIYDKGVLGVGTELAALVARGSVHAALISVSNLTPILNTLDILNIPFWCSKRHNYLNLIASKIWQEQVINKIHQQGKLRILMHYVPGSRTVTSTKQFGQTLKTPHDMKDVVFRIPASTVLQQFYEMCGTSAVRVPWKKAAQVAQGGRIDALDPSIVGLFNGPNNLKAHLGAISQIDSVQDGWLLVINQPWFNTLPTRLKLSLEEAAQKTFTEHLNHIEHVERYCEIGLEELGCKLYKPTVDEMALWYAVAGPTLAQWKPTKQKLLGSEALFEQFHEAARN